MKGGVNTFPFHNLLPYSESNEGLFLFFSPSLNWIKEKSVATLATRNIFAIKSKIKSQSQFTVLQNWRLCRGDTLKREYLRNFLDHFYCFLFDLLALSLRVAWVLYLWGILHPDPGFFR